MGWKVELALDGLEGVLVIAHEECGGSTRIPLRDAKGRHTCSCGAVMEFSDDNFRKVQESFDSLGQALKGFSR